MLTAIELEKLLVLAGEAAREAGQYIAQFDRSLLAVNNKEQGSSQASQVVTQVDIACEQLIRERLTASCEQLNIAFLGEESSAQLPLQQHPRLTKAYFWCVDPLDGTLPFIEGINGYAVSIALVNKAGQSLLGAVYDPLSDTLYQGIAPSDSFSDKALLLKNNKHWQLESSTSPEAKNLLSVFFDRSFLSQAIYPKVLKALNERALVLGYSGIKVNSQYGAVINAIEVLEQSPACYFKFPKASQGGGSVWDFAASSAIIKAAGGWVSDIHGNPLMLNQADTLFMNQKGIVYASNQALAEVAIDIYKSLK